MRLLLKALPLALVLSLWTTLAFAGRLQVTDEAHLLSSSDVSSLSATAARWSFDTHLLITVAPAKAALENRAHAWVDAPNVVVIALDPDHHSTIVRFGVGTNVKSMDFDSISAAGNPAFREKNWRAGIELIGARADVSARTATGTGTVAPQAPIVVHEGLGFWGWALILLGVGALVWLVVRLYRKSQRDSERFQRALDDNTSEMGSLASRNIAEDRWEAGVRASAARSSASASVSRGTTYVPAARSAAYVPSPAPVVVAPAPAVSSSTVVVNGGGGLGGNGFVEGMLVNEMMHDHRHHDTYVERERIVERPVYSAPAPSVASTYDSGGSSGSYDAGGSSSSWGSSSGSSSSSSDSGSSSSWGSSSGSSSSYDSGSSGGSSSSWDSGSSSSSDSSSSSSSWDSGSSSSSYDSGSSSFDSGGSSDSGGGSSDW